MNKPIVCPEQIEADSAAQETGKKCIFSLKFDNTNYKYNRRFIIGRE